jgi:Cu(I)/Ag(I) efflux system membrane protein CusA/SilA
MINRINEWSLNHRLAVVCGLLLLSGWGIHAVRNAPINAMPDLSGNQAIVFADWAGLSPQAEEDQVTHPFFVSLQALASVKAVRASSMIGLSFTPVLFEDQVDEFGLKPAENAL